MHTYNTFDYQFVGLVKVVLVTDLILCNMDEAVNVGGFKYFMVSANVARIKSRKSTKT